MKTLRAGSIIHLFAAIHVIVTLSCRIVGIGDSMLLTLLTMAMTALGAETSIEKFKRAGAKPFLLATLLYIWLLAGGYLLAKYLTPIL